MIQWDTERLSTAGLSLILLSTRMAEMDARACLRGIRRAGRVMSGWLGCNFPGGYP
jgi:hypothetical protein